MEGLFTEQESASGYPWIRSTLHGYAAEGMLQPDERPHGGIWPRSLALWAAEFYMALFILRPWDQMLPWLQAIYFERLFAISVFLIVVLTCGFQLKWSGQTAAVLLFLAGLAVSGMYAWKPELSWNAVYPYLVLVFFYFVLVSVVTTPYELAFFVLCYIVVMGVYLAKAQQGFVQYGGIRATGIVRLVGIEKSFGDPNYLAESIALTFPMLLFLYRIRREFTYTWPEVWRRWFPIGLGVYLVLALVSLVMTNSRAGMATCALLVGVVALQGQDTFRKIIRGIVALALLLTFWIIMPAQYKDRVRTLWDPDSGPEYAKQSAEGRSEGFRAGLEAFRRFPLTGVGPGSLFAYRVECIDGVPLATHSMSGQLLGGTGLVGTAAFLFLLGATLLNCRRMRLLAGGAEIPAAKVFFELSLAIRASIILLLFGGLSLHNLYRFNYLWLGAFALLGVRFITTVRANADAGGES